MTLAECVHTSTQSHMRDDLPVASEPPHLRCLTVFGVFLSQTRAAQHSPKITHYHCLPFFSVATADHCCVYDYRKGPLCWLQKRRRKEIKKNGNEKKKSHGVTVSGVSRWSMNRSENGFNASRMQKPITEAVSLPGPAEIMWCTSSAPAASEIPYHESALHSVQRNGN